MPTAAADRRVPALDGLRALAVLLVLAYHGGVPGFEVGGFYGVDVFFVLSGFLITRLLLGGATTRSSVGLADFWSRRARRLMPGLLVMLVVVSIYVGYFAPAGRYPGFRGDGLSTLTYWSNWHFIEASSNYFSATGFPSLLTHTWSLAIEEQFYLVWPLLLWVAVGLARRARVDPARLVLAASMLGSVASATWMAVLYRSGADVSRLYYGTDTHAQSILVGCALAAFTASVPISIRSRSAAVAAVPATGALVWAACALGSSDAVTYQGGFLVVSLSAAVLVAVVIGAPASPPARALSWAPLAYVGRISYGMYLWYFPLFAVMDRSTTGLAGWELLGARCAADVAVAAISFHLVEQPVRSWKPRLGLPVPAPAPALALGAAALFGAAVLLVVATSAGPVAGPVAPPAALAAQNPTTTGGQVARVLVFGDSTAATLGDDLALSPDVRSHRVALDVVGMFGCGLATSAAVLAHGQPTTAPTSCRPGTPPQDAWPALLSRAMTAFHPTMVLVAAGRWEVESRQAAPGGPWFNITQSQDASYIRNQLSAAAAVVIGGGARLGLATAPCYSSGEQPNGDPWPEDSLTRLDAYNAIVRQVVADQASAHPGDAKVVDLESIVCPGNAFRTTIDGITVRAPDGIHYPFFDLKDQNAEEPDTLSQAESFGTWIEPRILAALAS